jgi:hypothetical protein
MRGLAAGLAAVELELTKVAAVSGAELRAENFTAMIHKLSYSFIKPVNEPDAIPRCVHSVGMSWICVGVRLRHVVRTVL